MEWVAWEIINMANVNTERVQYWNGVLNQELSSIVESHNLGKSFESPQNIAFNFLYAAYNEASFAGYEEHPFVKKIGQAILHQNRKNIRPVLHTLADQLDLTGERHFNQSEALRALAQEFKSRRAKRD